MQEKESNLLLLKKQLEEICVETEYNQFCEMVQQKVEQHSRLVLIIRKKGSHDILMSRQRL